MQIRHNEFHSRRCERLHGLYIAVVGGLLAIDVQQQHAAANTHFCCWPCCFGIAILIPSAGCCLRPLWPHSKRPRAHAEINECDACKSDGCKQGSFLIIPPPPIPCGGVRAKQAQRSRYIHADDRGEKNDEGGTDTYRLYIYTYIEEVIVCNAVS